MKSNRRAKFKQFYARTLTIGLISTVLVVHPSLASEIPAQNWGTTGNEVLSESCNLINAIKRWLFGVVYVLGAIGLVLIAISAFLGRFKFAHLIALGGGLFIVAAADMLIGFITAGDKADCTIS